MVYSDVPSLAPVKMPLGPGPPFRFWHDILFWCSRSPARIFHSEARDPQRDRFAPPLTTHEVYMGTATANVTDIKATPGAEMISGGQIVAKMLKQEGIRHIFTISGGHIVDIYNGCIDEGIEIFDVRHEQVAAHAADAYARITGMGCAVVTAGPGTTDAVTGMANAYRAAGPMLLIGGNSPLKQYRMGGLQELRHTEMMTPISKFASLVMTTDRVAEMMAIAFREMYNGAPGPGFLEIPHDIMDGKVEAAKVRYPKNFRVRGDNGGPPDFIGDPKIVQQVADLRSEERRVGKGWGSGWSREPLAQ